MARHLGHSLLAEPSYHGHARALPVLHLIASMYAANPKGSVFGRAEHDVDQAAYTCLSYFESQARLPLNWNKGLHRDGPR